MNRITLIVSINTFLAFISILIWIYFQNKFKEPAAFTALTWLINVFLFGLYYLHLLIDFPIIEGENLLLIRTWGSLINTHGILLLFIGSIIACDRLRNNKTYMDRLEKKLMKNITEVENKNGDKHI